MAYFPQNHDPYSKTASMNSGDPRITQMEQNYQRTLQQYHKRNPISGDPRLVQMKQYREHTIQRAMKNPSQFQKSFPNLNEILPISKNYFKNAGNNKPILLAPPPPPPPPPNAKKSQKPVKSPYTTRITGMVTNYRIEAHGENTSHYFTIGDESSGFEIELVQIALDPTLGNPMEEIVFFEERYREFVQYQAWLSVVSDYKASNPYSIQGIDTILHILTIIAEAARPVEVFVDVNTQDYPYNKATPVAGQWGFIWDSEA